MSKPRIKILLCFLLYPVLFWSIWAAWQEIQGLRHDPHSVSMTQTPIVRGERLDEPTSLQPSPATKNGKLDARNLSPEQRAELAKELGKPPQREGYKSLSFQFLSGFECGGDETGVAPTIPDRILALDKKKVGVTGFMVPMELQGEKTTRFILIRNQLLCCYGEEPKVNEWIYVAFDEPVPIIADKPVAIFGLLESFPDTVEGQLVSLYTMNGHFIQVLD